MDVLLGQLKHMEAQVGLENQDSVFTRDSIQKILAAEKELEWDTQLYKGHLGQLSVQMSHALDNEAHVMEELYKAEKAENRYKAYPVGHPAPSPQKNAATSDNLHFGVAPLATFSCMIATHMF